MGNGYPTNSEFGLQTVQRQLRILIEPLMDKSTMRLQNTFAMSTHLGWRNRAGRAISLRPLHYRGNRHPKARCHQTATLTIQNRSNNPLTKII